MRSLQICVLILTVTHSVGAADDAWTLVATRDGVGTYENRSKTNGYREYRGIARLPVDFDEAVAVIKDIPGTVDWLPRTRRSDEIRRLSETEVLLYVVSNAPWPFKDREMVWKRHSLTDTDDHFLMTFDAVPEPYDGETGTLRVNSAHGEWELRKLGDGETEVRFQYVGESGGSVPRSFVDSNNRSLPYKVLVALQARIEELRESSD
jgi:hypothetical protein